MNSKTLLKVLSISSLVVLCACKTPVESSPSTHEHAFSTEWSNDAKHHWKTCVGCEEVDLKAEHEFDEGKITTSATCEEKGVKTFTCKTCDYTKTEDVEATNHNYKEATYAWNEDFSECVATRVCANNESHKDVLSAVITSETTASKCDEEGSIIYTATFDKDWATTQTTTKVLGVLGHSYKEATYAWNEDFSECVATRVCNHDSNHKETVSAVITSSTQEASCEETGKTTYTATFDKDWATTQLQEVPINSKGHSYGDTTYTWNEDFSECVATRVCAHDSNHKETVSAVIKSETPTVICGNERTTTYTATFDKDWATTQTKTKKLETLNHNYKGVITTYPSEGVTGVKTYTCEHCSDTYTKAIYEVNWVVGTKTTTTYVEEGKQATFDESVEIAPKTETIAYAFQGWSTTENGNVVELGTISSNMTYYATYKEVTRNYKLSINYLYADGTKAADSVIRTNYLYKDIYEKVESPEIDGYLPSIPYIEGIANKDREYTVYYHQINAWDGSVSNSFEGGTGTQEDPYLIKTAAQLAYLASSTNANNDYYAGVYFKMVSTIDLNNIEWAGIGGGQANDAFAGHFDGNNLAVYNLNINATTPRRGLFNSASGSISNLIVEGKVVSSEDYSGLLAGMNYSITENCHAFGTVESTATRAALLIGIQSAGAVNNCTSHGTATVTGYSGGLIGYNFKDASGNIANISNCDNFANVTSTAEDKNIGGVMGICGSGSTITNCNNFGKVVANSSTEGKIAGIVGYLYTSTVENCCNYGEIQGSTYVGGIAGQSEGVIRNSTNKAVVTAKSYVGGIVGVSGKATTSDFAKEYILECVNYGNVTAISSDDKGTAGIVGFSYVDVKNCENHGEISGASRVGGIVGGSKYCAASKALTIDSCVNTAAVSGTSKTISGIVGRIEGSSACLYTVSNCSNFGNISNTGTGGYVGGVVGYGKYGEVSNNTNTGTISSSGSNVGEVYGQVVNTTQN